MKDISEKGWLRRGFRVTGRVQGVYYRAWARGVANELGLRGTVRNRTDGSVEVQVVGTPGAVTDFEARLWEGPTSASVEGVEPVSSSDFLPAGPFQILPTA
jgi:acylphosphatase